ncbi:hypothetical protein D3C75_221340 [compost metagenome]
MDRMGQQIFARSGVAGDKQRCRQIRQLARLIDHMTHFRTHRHNLTKGAHILARQVLQLTSHSHRGAQHDN